MTEKRGNGTIALNPTNPGRAAGDAWHRPYVDAWHRPYVDAWHRPYVDAWHRPYVDGWHRPYVDGWHRPYVDAWHRPYVDAWHRPYESWIWALNVDLLATIGPSTLSTTSRSISVAATIVTRRSGLAIAGIEA